jgi:hypothetical protein
MIDTEDYEKLAKYNWMCHGRYARRVEKGQTIHMHRLLMNCPNGFEVDHINRNRLDNRKSNLRIVTRQQNMCNKASYAESSSKYKGVSWHSKDRLWHAQIRVNHKINFIGAYEKEEVAAAAYNYNAQIYFGTYAVLNDVEDVDFRKHRILKKKGKSKFRGVTLVGFGKWEARIGFKGLRLSLGYFETEEEAALAYNTAFQKYRNRDEAPNAV